MMPMALQSSSWNLAKDKTTAESLALCTDPQKHVHGEGKPSRKAGAAEGTAQAGFCSCIPPCPGWCVFLSTICRQINPLGIF